MQPLESADRHPAPLQKLPTSKQPTPPAAPASAPPLSSASIASSPLSLNLFPYTLPHSLQTGDSNLVANTTIHSSRREKVPQQRGQDLDRPPSLLPLPVNGSGQPLLSPESTSSPTVQVPIDEDSEEAVLAKQNMPLQDIVERSSTRFRYCRRPAVTRLPLRRSSLLRRCSRWSQPIDTLRHRHRRTADPA